ncbi:rnase h yqgf: putative transcription antitermination factor yqgf [Lucifera butyrica]|uniref:Putative pre-16S rRNA nuclease n=1 Tax=Lucifera butyrica TaxID=1351585 RepID=A0A498R6X7_9FIRM|nr:Holliday junction resolvase RuvX [Lucifera butyrica]VBB06022.1 rnase h yqgf: putative transcription antitermination factor yqgf [Lucifera butyrica]
MGILALDVGDKTIGVAVSDSLLLTAQGLEVIRRTSIANDFSRLKEIIAQYQIHTIIVGFPKNMNGTIGPRGELTKKFASQLSQSFSQVQVKLWDERLSTVAAERSLIAADVKRAKRKKVIDKMAAVFILQGYLDSLPR